MNTVGSWLAAHPQLCAAVIWPVVTGVLTALFKPRSPEEYARLPPRLAAFIKLVAALGLDFPKMLEASGQVMKGKK